VRLVVARYNEPLDWLADVPAGWEVFVYAKGEPLEPRDGVTVIQRPNLGREAETFAHHNATVAPDGYTAFLQGNPFDHFRDPLGHIEAIVASGDRVGWLGYHYDTAWNEPPHTLESLDFRTVWHDLGLEGICPTRLSFPAGAQMVVAPQVIKARHHAWWQRAAEVAATEDVRVAHCFERLWPFIYRGGQ
jgi:hypothetical protein